MSFDLLREISTTETGVIQLPFGKTVLEEVLVIDKDITIQGCSMTGSGLVCPGVHVTTRGCVNFRDFRLTGPGSGVGIFFDYAFHSSLERILIEGFDKSVAVRAGNCWDITRCYLVPKKIGVEVDNVENADEGDWSIFGTTITDAGGGISGVHILNSGGGRLIDNKALGFMYPILLETTGDTSDLLLLGNSIENFSAVGIAERVASGSFENTVIVGNQFEGPGAPITLNGVNRDAVIGNAANCPGPVVQTAVVTNLINLGNAGR